jgi:peroxiredoxin
VANKNLVKIYPRLKEKGVVVISISLDENRKPWLEAVKKDRLAWVQLREARGWYSSVTTDWAVNKIPATFLIDQEGTVVGRDLVEVELEKLVSELIR